LNGQGTDYKNAQSNVEIENLQMTTTSYDSKSRVASISGGPSWSKTSIGYNSFGNGTHEIITIPGLSAKTVSHAYDGNNQLKQVTYPDGKNACFTNNGLNMPEKIAFINSTSYLVNAITNGIGNQPTSVNINANGTSYVAEYNVNGGLTSAQLKKNSSFLYKANYTYDNVGNIASLTNTTPSANASFQYDAFNRLTKATYPKKIFDYAYDSFGNMLTAKENSVTVFNKTYTNQNQVSGFSYIRGNLTQGDGFSQAWDNRNRLSESRITATSFLLGRYVYEEHGLRLKAERFAQPTVQVVKPNGGESLYLGALDTISWSSMGQTGTLKLELLVNGVVDGTIAENLPATQTSYQWQVGKTLTGSGNTGTNFKVRVSSLVPTTATTTYYFYDYSGRLLAEYDQAGSCLKDYIYNGSKLLAEYQPSGSKYYYYTSDQINSTRIITNSSGSVVYSALFDPYGGMQKQWVNTYSPSLKFSGKEREASSELDYFGARYYGHRQYRFLSVDPVINKDEALGNPQLWNLYSYCKNNPITYLDLDGRWSETIHNQIIDAAFSSGKYQLPENIRNIFKEASAYVDTDQSLAGSYKHAMSAPWQTPANAEKQMGKFLSDMKSQYHNFMSKGKKYEAYFALGMAMHALMDSTSPTHEGYQIWNGIKLDPSLIKTIEHPFGETDKVYNSNLGIQTKSIEKLRSYIDETKK
jgi:RHS repeat-associated protein